MIAGFIAACLVVGDSIAQGVAQHLPACDSQTKVGINTRDALKRFRYVKQADSTVISLGVNDTGTSIPTGGNLEKIRLHFTGKVVWILPAKPAAKMAVLEVAGKHHDSTIDIDNIIGVDGIHPTATGYRVVAKRLLNNQ